MWDLLVIGGGLAGLSLAREAAARGLRTAVVQRRRLGSGASGAWHGLLTGAVAGDALRATAAERRLRGELLRSAPHLVTPERVVAPDWSGEVRWPLRQRGLQLRWELLGAPDGNLRNVESLNKHRLLAAEPALRLRGLAGALAVPVAAVDPGAFLLALARAAADAGAALATHAPALALLEDGAGRVTGALVQDALTGEAVPVQAAMTVLAVGAATPPARRRWNEEPRPSADENALPASTGASAAGYERTGSPAPRAPTATARLLTLAAARVEVRGTLLVTSALDGTALLLRRHGATVLAGPVRPMADDGTSAWITATLRGLNAALPAARLSHGDVLGVRAAPVPAEADGTAAEAALGDGVLGPGLAAFSGGTPLALLLRAPDALRTIADAAGFRPAPAVPLRLPGAEARDLTPLAGLGMEAGLPPAAAAHCLAAYGAEAAALFNRCQQDRQLRRPLHPDHPAISAEVEFAVQRGFAATVDDVLDGVLGLDLRTPDGGAAAAETTARLLAASRGWTDDEARAAAAAHVAATARAASRIAALGA